MKVKTKVVKTIEIDHIDIYAKVSDRLNLRFYDPSGACIAEHDGYVPSFLYKNSDYLKLTINLDTGQILNWQKPSASQLEEFLETAQSEEDEEDDDLPCSNTRYMGPFERTKR